MMDGPPIIEAATFERVVALLKPRKTRELIEILRARVVELSEMDDEDIAGPRGRAHAHRLTSEAGLLGFQRLSVACAILGDSSDQSIAEQVEQARASIHEILEQTHQEICRSLTHPIFRDDHDVAR